MTANQFKKIQLAFGLKNQGMADLLYVTIGYVEKLRNGSRTASKSLVRIITLEIERRKIEVSHDITKLY